MDKIQENWDKFEEKPIIYHKFPINKEGFTPWEWETEIWNGVKIAPRGFKIDWDWKFFAIIPAFNINIHSLNLEFEWLFLGVYWNFWKRNDIYINKDASWDDIIWKEPRKIGKNECNL